MFINIKSVLFRGYKLSWTTKKFAKPLKNLCFRFFMVNFPNLNLLKIKEILNRNSKFGKFCVAAQIFIRKIQPATKFCVVVLWLVNHSDHPNTMMDLKELFQPLTSLLYWTMLAACTVGPGIILLFFYFFLFTVNPNFIPCPFLGLR